MQCFLLELHGVVQTFFNQLIFLLRVRTVSGAPADSSARLVRGGAVARHEMRAQRYRRLSPDEKRTWDLGN